MKCRTVFSRYLGIVILITSAYTVGDAIAQVEDVTPPALINFTVTPTTIETDGESKSLDLFLELHDEGSGIDETIKSVTQFTHPWSLLLIHVGTEPSFCAFFGGSTCPDSVPENLDPTTPSNDGDTVTHRFTVDFDPCTQTNALTSIRLLATDRAGNTSEFLEANLVALGFTAEVPFLPPLDLNVCTPEPDLTARPHRFKYRETLNGDVLVVDVTLENRSEVSIRDPFLVSLTVHDENGPVLIDTVPRIIHSIERFGAGESRVLFFRADNMESLAGMTAVITIDPESQIKEGNEQNNQLFFTIGGIVAP